MTAKTFAVTLNNIYVNENINHYLRLTPERTSSPCSSPNVGDRPKQNDHRRWLVRSHFFSTVRKQRVKKIVPIIPYTQLARLYTVSEHHRPKTLHLLTESETLSNTEYMVLQKTIIRYRTTHKTTQYSRFCPDGIIGSLECWSFPVCVERTRKSKSCNPRGQEGEFI